MVLTVAGNTCTPGALAHPFSSSTAHELSFMQFSHKLTRPLRKIGFLPLSAFWAIDLNPAQGMFHFSREGRLAAIAAGAWSGSGLVSGSLSTIENTKPRSVQHLAQMIELPTLPALNAIVSRKMQADVNLSAVTLQAEALIKMTLKKKKKKEKVFHSYNLLEFIFFKNTSLLFF